MTALIKSLYDNFSDYIANPSNPYWAGYILFFFLVSFLYAWRTEGKFSIQNFVSAEIRRYSSRSSVNDFKIVIVNTILISIFLVFVFDCFAYATGRGNVMLTWAEAHFPKNHGPLIQPTLAAQILFGVFAVVAVDFAYYFWHRAFHKIPFLWETHKIHHSAELLTPFTNLRTDPYTIVLYVLYFETLAGVLRMVSYLLFRGQAEDLTILGIPAAWFFLHLFRHNFLHSHIPVSYGRFNFLLMSPQHHQIHHSIDPKHRHKNFGLVFPWMDMLFGTYVSLEKGEKLTIGIDGVEEKKINAMGVAEITLYPLRRIFFPERPQAAAHTSQKELGRERFVASLRK